MKISILQRATDYLLALLPLVPSAILAATITNLPIIHMLIASLAISIGGCCLTNYLVPVIAEFTLKRGLTGKDMGKKGTLRESKDIPEALGIVAGTVFLMTAILSQLLFAANVQQLVIYNSALFSICFMIFLGFTDDTLDLKWRYKLFLPTIASLPLLSTYSGSTAVYIPEPFRHLLMSEGKLTGLGTMIDAIATVDTEASGAIIELGYLFLVFMGLLAVFCTNAINILAGINGLETGQSYVIACSILFFKMYDISRGSMGENQMFSILMIMPFIGTTLGLLRHNWYPADVFVGDTFCYFAGMTFAVVGIHGHFSKTLLLLFIPQIFNFLYSLPQLFKVMPCPRHRLPKIDLMTGLMRASTFPCKEGEHRWAKVRRNDVECPNRTLICLVLRTLGPMKERSLCLVLLAIQVVCSVFAFYVRYSLLEQPISSDSPPLHL
jgi:UDP-N-acetylglucosamine--dolichyl-phosphate N-acetylglucosaminephosphotransferase